MQEVSFSYLDELNDVQRQAVTCLQGPVMVIAGPGSGKTRVLTYRIAHLINSGVAPWNILTLTFTNKAAKEMKGRIEKVVGNKANKVWAGTFHSIFARILRVEAHRIGYPNDFTIYDTDDSKSVIKEVVKSLSLDPKIYNPRAILSRISSAKSNLITPKNYIKNEDLMNYDKMNRRPMTHIIYDKYVAKCLRAGAMDFDDLLLQMFRLLYQNPDNIKQKYQAQFQYLLVDEFQDTNFLQYEIIKQFVCYEGSLNNICIVGDDAQSIYSFRGATIENILQFENDFKDVNTFKLEQNYRSTSYIVNAANEVINYNKNQIDKKIWTDKEDGQKIKIIKTMSDNEEGRRIADTIIEQKNRYSLRNDEIAILYRTNSQSRVFEEHLRRFNIAYRIYGGLSFYQRKEVKDLLGYIRLAANPKDDEAFKRVINYPKRGLGNTTVNKLIQIAEENQMSLMEVVMQIELKARPKKIIGEFVAMMKSFAVKATHTNAYDVAIYIAQKTGITGLLKADTSAEGMGRLENVNALLDSIKEFVENDELEDGEEVLDKSLSKFLQGITLMTDQDKNEEETNVVTLMSTHAAKGLEFKSVFVVGLEENLFPSFMALSNPHQIEEERRLFYVALTRAEMYLTLSYANSRYQFGQMRFNDPSRFLEEISEENIDNITILKNSGSGMSSRPSTGGFGQPKILGNFKRLEPSKINKALQMDPKDFKQSPAASIKEGMKVMHLKFGLGEVKSVDARKVATIHFSGIGDNPEKRIMLQYAKLQIIEDDA